MDTNRVLIAMSGGVDSSVAALLMKKRGYDCLGVTMELLQGLNLPEDGTGKDARDAASVAEKLDIPFECLDFSENFRENVVELFVRAYEQGATPNPCVLCNRYLKFGLLQKAGAERGYSELATGHYARIEQDPETGRYLLKKAADPDKDQTYMLYSLTQEELSHVHFPLGELTKGEIRRMAEEAGLVTSHKKDSQDICFVPHGSYADFIEGYLGKTYPPGEFVDREGRVLGTHRGVIRYTVGQRKGLGLALPAPMYVVRLDLPRNRVVLGFDRDLFSREMILEDCNLIAMPKLENGLRCEVKARYSHRASPAMAIPLSETRIKVVFDDPQRALTPGQAAVLYQGDLVIGGGTITGEET